MAAPSPPLKRARTNDDSTTPDDSDTIADLERQVTALKQQVDAGERQRLGMLVMLDRYANMGGVVYQYTADMRLVRYVSEDDPDYESPKCECADCVERDGETYDQYGRQEQCSRVYFPTVSTRAALVRNVVPCVENNRIADEMDGAVKASLVAWLRGEPWKNFGDQPFAMGRRVVSWKWDSDEALETQVDSDGDSIEVEYSEIERLVFEVELEQVRGKMKTKTEFRRDFRYNGTGVGV